MSTGIDYGHGLTNIDHATGIRYGVISQHSLAEWFFNEIESDYGEPHCPKCGAEAYNSNEADFDDESGSGAKSDIWFDGKDYYCLSCKFCFWSEEAFPEEPQGFSIDDGNYLAVDCLDSDVMVIKAPFYTYAPFCSPCVPGAGNLDGIQTTRIDASCPKTYCFGHGWFEGGRAPYRVFRVNDDVEVLPEA